METFVLKKDGSLQKFDVTKVLNAVNKSAERVMHRFSENEISYIVNTVNEMVKLKCAEGDGTVLTVNTMHGIAESVLDSINPTIAKSYREYRNYKIDFRDMLDSVYRKSQHISYIGDVSNANTDSSMISTQRSLVYGELNKLLYKKFFLNKEEIQACNDGYIYIHDMKDRRDSINCCLCDISSVLDGGFVMGNVPYTDPKTLDVVFDVISDLTISASSQQYGGFTIPEVDTILSKYAERSYQKYKSEYLENISEYMEITDEVLKKADNIASHKVYRDFEQGFQSWEMRFNTVGSSRGDYPFVSISFGNDISRWAVMATIAALRVRKRGQGKEGFRKAVLFPKLTFLYNEELHGEGKEYEFMFNEAIECNKKAMYPDYLSLTGEGYIPSIYKKYGKVVSLMGCRASLSPWFERGGIHPADEDDQPVFVGRCNLGAISLHLPMILAKARKDGVDFYQVLDYYLELIRNLHKKTFDYLSNKVASTNPIQFMEGGFLNGHLQANEKIGKILKPMTMSFGITALNELQELYNGKSIYEDGEFALEVLKYINTKVEQFKEEDQLLYAIYGTPAESLCLAKGTIVKMDDGSYKNIENIKVGDKVYTYNVNSRKSEVGEVLYSNITNKSAHVVKITLEDDNSFICTFNHKIAVFTEFDAIEYVNAEDLCYGNLLVRGDGSACRIKKIESLDEPMETYDITVRGNHNFIVSGANVVVHNCGLQIKQFREAFGIIDKVSTREYVSNSFHCHVTEPISPIEKQDSENRFWNYMNGGKIQYSRYPVNYNTTAMKTIVRRAMKLGFYEGVNETLSYCDDCGHEELNMTDKCPKCGSDRLTIEDRMNGYLGYTKVNGKSRFNHAKLIEIKERVSM